MAAPADLLAALVGDWSGTNRLYFEPGNLAEESDTSGWVRLAVGGRAAVHEYRWSFEGDTHTGLALVTFTDEGFQGSWVDTFHTAGSIMALAPVPGTPPDDVVVQGSYPAGDGPDWGWRIQWARAADGSGLAVTMWNVPPNGDPGVAVEMTLNPADL